MVQEVDENDPPPEAYGYEDEVTPAMLEELRRRAAPKLEGKRWVQIDPPPVAEDG